MTKKVSTMSSKRHVTNVPSGAFPTAPRMGVLDERAGSGGESWIKANREFVRTVLSGAWLTNCSSPPSDPLWNRWRQGSETSGDLKSL
jgi:hypothetical protein